MKTVQQTPSEVAQKWWRRVPEQGRLPLLGFAVGGFGEEEDRVWKLGFSY